MCNIIGLVKWNSNNVLIGKRVFLFCFCQKCMSGRINEIQKTNKPNEFKIWINFIEPDYFKDNIVLDNSFTMNEASKILGKGKIKGIT